MSVYIIAEAGVNHNGSLDMALKLVEQAARVGADAVKFQTFSTEATISKFAEKAEYQKITTAYEENQFDMVKKLELSYEDFEAIKKHCDIHNITFLSTGFDTKSLTFLDKVLNIPVIKIPSGDINNGPLVLQAAQTNKNILLSTGMSDIQTIHNALAIIDYGYNNNKQPSSFEEIYRLYVKSDKIQLREKVTLLQCTTEYPTPVDEINLSALNTLKEEFNLEVGFSDHSKGVDATFLSVALGVKVIEKHFTLDNAMDGPDHKASLNPNDFETMVKKIRLAETILGNGEKVVMASEKKNINIARKSLIALRDIQQGEVFSSENLGVKRPGDGIEPIYYWEYIGTVANEKYSIDELIEVK